MRNYRVEWAEGEIEASALLDAIDELRADRATLQQMAHCLKDRLEASESALSNLGVTPEEAKEGLARHKATLARLEVVEKEHQHVLEVKEIYQRQLNETEDERDELRARIREMERQEPIAKVRIHKAGGNAGLAWSVAPLNDFDSLPLMRDGDRLYALPGAKGE